MYVRTLNHVSEDVCMCVCTYTRMFTYRVCVHVCVCVCVCDPHNSCDVLICVALSLTQTFAGCCLKVGVVHIKKGQTKEGEIFANLHEPSGYFDKFLQMIGETAPYIVCYCCHDNHDTLVMVLWQGLLCTCSVYVCTYVCSVYVCMYV